MSPLLEEMPDRAEESARANMIRPLVYHSSGTSCHLLYKRRLLQIVSSPRGDARQGRGVRC